MTDQPGTPKKRLKAADSRRSLLDAGRQLLQEHGVAPGLDRVTLKDAIELSGVPRSTAYRLYEGGEGQLEEFRADLLTHLDGGIDMTGTMDAVSEVLEENSDVLESGDPVERAYALREVIRRGVNQNVDDVAASVEWRIYLSTLSSLGSGHQVSPHLTELFRSASAEVSDRFVPVFQSLSDMFGIRYQPWVTVDAFSAMAVACIEGVALRKHVDDKLVDIKRATGPNGELQSWSAASVAFEALTVMCHEPDPSADASADLSVWSAFPAI